MRKKSNSNKFFEYLHFLDFSWPSWPPLKKKASFANAEIFKIFQISLYPSRISSEQCNCATEKF